MAKDGFHADDGFFYQWSFSIDKVRSFTSVTISTIISFSTRYNSYSIKTKKVHFLESWPHYRAIVFYAKKMVIL